MRELSLAEVAELAGGRLAGEGTARVRGVAPLESAGPDQLSFVANARYQAYLEDTRAAAVLVPAALESAVPARLARVVVDDPHVALYRLLQVLYPPAPAPEGVHPTAVIDASAELGAGVSVGPYAVVGAGAQIGAGSRLGGHVVVGERCKIGEDCTLHPHATLYEGVRLGARCVVHSGARLGREGFGYVWLDGGHRKVPQVGGCVIGDDVEIGTNATIDRGSIGDTVVGAGTKIDSLVHLGHNVRVGTHVILAAQVGIAGSASLGDGAVLGGQVGVGGHLTVGARVRAGGQAGIIGDIAPGETVSGYPARPHREALRAQGALFRLPQLLKRLRAIERRLGTESGQDD